MSLTWTNFTKSMTNFKLFCHPKHIANKKIKNSSFVYFFLNTLFGYTFFSRDPKAK